MQLANIEGLNDAEKLKYLEKALAMRIPEQRVTISAFSDDVIAEEYFFRLDESVKKEEAHRRISEDDPIWRGWN